MGNGAGGFVALAPSALAPEPPLRPRRIGRLLGVDYWHLKRPDGGRLYLTAHGLRFAEHLLPENWLESSWFTDHRCRLRGTSTIFYTRTKPVRGRALELVVRYSRMGEDIPGDPDALSAFSRAEFNSPFEEFGLLTELRVGRFGPPALRIRTKRPLAFYEAPARLAVWQTGRKEYRIASKQARHPEAKIDLRKQYMMIYEWIDGYDLEQAADLLGIHGERRRRLIEQETDRVVEQVRQKGFEVADMKPAHIIVRLDAMGRLLRRRDGSLVYALIDYELIERTREYESWLDAHSPPQRAGR
jgi:hypothetical protein